MVADGTEYYASYADVRNLLMNENLGVANATLWDDNAIEKGLKIDQGKINWKIGLRNTLTSYSGDVVVVEILRGIMYTLQLQRVLVARHANQNNLSAIETLQAFWTISPTFTFAQLNDMKEIKREIRASRGFFNHNIWSGGRVG